jgi:hypothetical protein
MILFPEGRDRRGWGHVFGELSKALASFEATMVSSSFGGAQVGKRLGKVAGFREGGALAGYYQRWRASGSDDDGGLVRGVEDHSVGSGA